MIYVARFVIVLDCLAFGFLVDRMAKDARTHRTRALDALGRCVARARTFEPAPGCSRGTGPDHRRGSRRRSVPAG